jgi:hypothetical protein
MTPQSSEWKKMVLRGARQLGIVLTPGQLDCFAQHATLLLEWNRKINLTAIVDPAEMAVKHYLDAIAPIKHIPLQGHLLDIGTGGGFPGIPLKVMRPDQPMTLIDGVRKKISFVKQAKGRPQFILHDGPPYANGHIHMGTALEQGAQGFHHSLPADGRFRRGLRAGMGLPRTAHRAQCGQKTRLQKKRDDPGPGPPRVPDLCRKFIDIQRDEFKRLGVWASGTIPT